MCVHLGSAPHLGTPVSARDFTRVHRAQSLGPGHTRTPRLSRPGRGMTPLRRPVDSARREKGASGGLTRLLGTGRGQTRPLSGPALRSLAAPGLCISWDAGVSLQWEAPCSCGPAPASGCALGEAGAGWPAALGPRPRPNRGATWRGPRSRPGPGRRAVPIARGGHTGPAPPRPRRPGSAFSAGCSSPHLPGAGRPARDTGGQACRGCTEGEE